MSESSAKDAAARLVFLTGIVNLASAEKDIQRAATFLAMEPGDAHAVRSSISGEKLARVRMSDPKPTAHVTDHVALTEWIGREYPDRVVVTTTISDQTDAVIAVLAEHAPGLVELSTGVPQWATDEVVKASTKAGRPVGPGGEVDVPGVEMRTGAPSVSVAEKSEHFEALILELVTAGRLSLDGTLRELPAADGPFVVDAEPGAA